MPRRREVPSDIPPDPKFGSVDVSKFVNVRDDRRQEVRRGAHHLWRVSTTSPARRQDPLEVFMQAVNNQSSRLSGAGRSSSLGRRMA